ncbi:MAG TPA: 16S rRNA (cytidine(1402)-2'-O)-methyltransferase [Acidimicrobiales bacterium]
MSAGRLVLVATPIGNLGDLSARQVEALRAAGAIACEDTRRTGRLLQHAGVPAPRLLVVNEHTEREQAEAVVGLLRQGVDVAVVTDAGTPGISDPGERLVRAAVDAGLEVTCVPGPSAAVAALVVSGLPTSRWVMEGFLPRSGSARTERLADVRHERRTIVLYEAPHRLARTLADLAEVLGGPRRVVVARELTKLHEEVWRGTLGEALERAHEDEPRGEHVIVVEGAPAPEPVTQDTIAEALRQALAGGQTKRDAVLDVAAALAVPRNQVYDVALRL